MSSEHPPTPANQQPLRTKEKISYGFGDVSNGLAVSSIGFFFPIYLTDVALLTPALASWAIGIGRVWDAVTDPLMGWISDNTRSRWGRRRPYLLFGAIPFALAFFSLWVVPEFKEHPQAYMLVYATIAFLIFNTCFTVVFVPYTSLTAAMTDDYNERTSLTGYRMAGSLCSMFLGAVLPTAILALIASADIQSLLTSSGVNSWFGSWAGTPRQAYFVMGSFFALVMIACTWTAFAGTRERHVEAGRRINNPLSYASHIVDELTKNRPYRISVLILLVTNTAATFVAANLVYYIQYVLLLKGHTGFLFMTLFFTAICCVPLWVGLAKRFGKTKTYRYAMLVYAGVVLCLTMLPPGIPLWPYLVAIGAGMFHSAALTLPWAIIPDVVEYDELKTGKRREGLFYGGSTFCYKLATTIPPVVSLRVLYACEYVPNLEHQAPAVTLGIRTLIGVVPALLLVWGSMLSQRHPLTEEKHREIVEALNERRINGNGKAKG